MKTIKTILSEMKASVELDVPPSPGWWIDKALELNIMWQDLKQDIIKYEMNYKNEISVLIEEGMKVSQAKLKVEGSSENYRLYKYLQGRNEIISEFIMLAKKRERIEQYYD